MKQTYIHYGINGREFRKDKIAPLSGGSDVGYKPFGGFWASPAGSGDGYRDFCHSNGQKYCDPSKAMGFSLSENARVLTLNTDESVRDFFVNYGVVWNATPYKEYLKEQPRAAARPVEMDLPMLSIDYTAVARDFDAVHLDVANSSDLAAIAFADSWEGNSIVVLNPDVIEPISDRATRELLQPKTDAEKLEDESFKRAFALTGKIDDEAILPYSKEDIFAAINDGNFSEARHIMDVLENGGKEPEPFEDKLDRATVKLKAAELQKALNEMMRENHRFNRYIEKERRGIEERREKRDKKSLLNPIIEKWKPDSNSNALSAALTMAFVIVLKLSKTVFDKISESRNGETELLKKANTINREIAQMEALMEDVNLKIADSPETAVKCMSELTMQAECITAKIRAIYSEYAITTFDTPDEIKEGEASLREISMDCADALKKAAEQTIDLAIKKEALAEKEKTPMLPPPSTIKLPSFDERMEKAQKDATTSAKEHTKTKTKHRTNRNAR